MSITQEAALVAMRLHHFHSTIGKTAEALVAQVPLAAPKITDKPEGFELETDGAKACELVVGWPGIGCVHVVTSKRSGGHMIYASIAGAEGDEGSDARRAFIQAFIDRGMSAAGYDAVPDNVEDEPTGKIERNPEPKVDPYETFDWSKLS